MFLTRKEDHPYPVPGIKHPVITILCATQVLFVVTILEHATTAVRTTLTAAGHEEVRTIRTDVTYQAAHDESTKSSKWQPGHHY